MTEEGLEREQRRRTRVGLGALSVAGLGVAVAAKAGWIDVLAGYSAIFVVMYAVFTFVVGRDRRAEARRRAGGAAPSWPAQLPVSAAVLLGAKAPGRHSRQRAAGELFGRLSLVEGRLRWEPRAGDRRRDVGPLEWDRSWTADVVRVWGPGSQGCLTLTHPGGSAVDLWIRHPADLRAKLTCP